MWRGWYRMDANRIITDQPDRPQIRPTLAIALKRGFTFWRNFQPVRREQPPLAHSPRLMTLRLTHTAWGYQVIDSHWPFSLSQISRRSSVFLSPLATLIDKRMFAIVVRDFALFTVLLAVLRALNWDTWKRETPYPILPQLERKSTHMGLVLSVLFAWPIVSCQNSQ